MTFTINSITTNNQPIKTFLDGGINLTAAPVESYILFQASALSANANYSWRLSELGYDVQPLSLWAYYGGSSPSGFIYVEILDHTGQNVIWAVKINANDTATKFETACYVEFPTMIVSKHYIGRIRCTNACASAGIVARKVYLEPAIAASV